MRRFSSLLIAALVPVAACDTNDSGNIASSSRHDLALPPLAMGSSEIRDWCGEGYPTEFGKDVDRLPYLQRVDAHGASVVWTSERRDLVVEVTDVDGAVLARIQGVVDPSSSDDRLRIARVPDLSADTIYCYTLRGPEGVVFERTGFRTAPERGDDRAISFTVFGDSGTGGEDQRALSTHIAAAPSDFILHVGDVVYGGGTRDLYDAHWFDAYAGVLERTPAFLASGNHDYDSGLKGFLEVFVLPENGTPGELERWYSFDWGPAHFVALDTERVTSAQLAWLEADLARNGQPWTIVFAHRPPYSSGEHGSDLPVQQKLVPIVERHHVQLVLSGHEHHYERMHELGGVTYVVTGGGGRGTRPVGSSDFTARSESVIHFVHVTIDGDLLTLRAIDGTGREFDAVVIDR